MHQQSATRYLQQQQRFLSQNSALDLGKTSRLWNRRKVYVQERREYAMRLRCKLGMNGLGLRDGRPADARASLGGQHSA